MRGTLQSNDLFTIALRKHWVAFLIVAIGCVTLYWNVARALVADWTIDENYSHGFLIVPLALYLAWERRTRVAALAARPSGFGLVVVAASLATLTVGVLGSEAFLTRISMLGALGGAILFLGGWNHLRVLMFPLAFLLLMIPVPALVFNEIAFPLQIFASRAGELTLSALAIPVLREGNVLVLANTSLEVAEACSGIRSLVSLLTLGIVYGYFSDTRPWVRIVIAVSTVPVAVVANGVRVAGTGIAAHFIGSAAAEGFLHTFSGWLVFIVSFVLMYSCHQVLVRLSPVGQAREPLGVTA
jgi:exosortase